MIPILYDSTETEFTNNGLGALADALECMVTEERNGEYTLRLTYPTSGALADQLITRNIILAKPNYSDRPQPFRISKIKKSLTGATVTVNAQHISYDLSGYTVDMFSVFNIQDALDGLIQYSLVPCPFTLTTDRTTVARFRVTEPSSIRSWFGGKQGSILDVYGGEWYYDRYTAELMINRGADRGLDIRYGKNLVTLEQEQECSNLYSGVYPYYVSMDGEVTTGDLVPVADVPYVRILSLDLSDKFDNDETPTSEDLTNAALYYIENNNLTAPKVNLKVSFVELGDQRVDLCDTVRVYFEKFGVSVQAKVVKTEWDVLLDRYDSVELGDAKKSIATTIVSNQQQASQALTDTRQAIGDVRQQASDDARQAVIEQTNLITGQTGGYFKIIYDNELTSPTYGQPTGWAIMDSPDVDSCVNVWRFTAGGMGHSSEGWDGPYSNISITMDGTIIAKELLVQSDQYLSSYFRVEMVNGNPVVKIGASSSDYILVMTADRIAFEDQYGNVQAYFEGDSFVLQELDTFKIGNLQIKTQGSPYSLSFVKAV